MASTGPDAEDLTKLVKRGVVSIAVARDHAERCLDAEMKKNKDLTAKLKEAIGAFKIVEKDCGNLRLLYARVLTNNGAVEKEKDDLIAKVKALESENKRLKLEKVMAEKEKDSSTEGLVSLLRLCLDRGAIMPRADGEVDRALKSGRRVELESAETFPPFPTFGAPVNGNRNSAHQTHAPQTAVTRSKRKRKDPFLDEFSDF
ncbi:hypothetical protein BSKO_09229 [Bryopsis sp. KO-2023]|nr:hypothetical protein BSKO_09229 [Bryopsis sp. KO-2023]